MDKLDTLLQKNPITLDVRAKLTQDTMEAARQVKRIRLAQRMLAGLFVIAMVLLIGKWLHNDLLYFIQLAFNKFGILKSQSVLFWNALIESLPKQQLFVMTIASILWLIWRKFETYLLHTRITNKMIRLTPRLVFITGFIALMGIGFAGYSYAQKTEQKQLQILKEYINQSGRKELETNISGNNCDATNNPNLTNLYEIKKEANITSSDAVKILEAACYQREAEKFLTKTFNLSDSGYGPMAGVGEDNKKILTTVVQVITKTDNSLTVDMRNIFSRQTDVFPKTFNLTSETKVYKDEKLVSQNTLQKGDTVMVLYTYSYSGARGSYPTSTKLDGIVLLPSALDFHWYNNDLQNSVTQIETCLGNPEDRCTVTGGIDFFPSGGGEGNPMNPLYIHNSNNEMKVIAGVLTQINETSVKIKSSSGRIFTIEFGSNPTEEFNRDRAKEYNNDKVTLGDTLLITYFESANQHTTSLRIEQIFNAVLMIEVINKFDPIKKY